MAIYKNDPSKTISTPRKWAAVVPCALMLLIGMHVPNTVRAATGRINPPVTPTAQPRATAKGQSRNIVINPLGGFHAMQVQITMKLDGKSSTGKTLRDTIHLDTAYDTKAHQQVISVSSNMLSQLFGNDDQSKALSPKRLAMYENGEARYMYLEGKQSICLPMKEDEFIQISEPFSIQKFLKELNLGDGNTTFVGTLTGEEMRNGVRTLRYQLDAKAMTALMRQANSTKSTSVNSGKLWTAKTSEHMVSLELNMLGTEEQVIGQENFTGKILIAINLSKFDEPLQIKLPKACQS